MNANWIECEEFEKEKYSTVVAEEDADFLIVSTAEKYSVSGTTWIIEEDIDLLVILTQHAPINTVYYLKPGKENVIAYITATVLNIWK